MFVYIVCVLEVAKGREDKGRRFRSSQPLTFNIGVRKSGARAERGLRGICLPRHG